MAWVNLSGAFGYGTILTSTQMQNLRDNIAAAFAKDSGAPVLADDYIVQAMMNDNSVGNDEITGNVGLVKFGTYSGNGSTDQGVTGAGFPPSGVLVASATDLAAKSGFLLISGMTAGRSLDFADGNLEDDTIISLDADGFSVDDGGSDLHPNKNGHGYVYIAWA